MNLNGVLGSFHLIIYHFVPIVDSNGYGNYTKKCIKIDKPKKDKSLIYAGGKKLHF